MKKAVIIACFYNYSYETRIRYLKKSLKSLGYDCLVIASDFDHRTKRKYEIKDNDVEVVNVIPYKKNLSIIRILSHRGFSIKARKKCEEIQPSFIYVGSPPNFNVKEFARFKKNNSNVEVFLGIGDMWPESFPVNNILKILLNPFLKLWANLRNDNLKFYDGILFECNLFKNKLINYIFDKKAATIYLSKKDFLPDVNWKLNKSIKNEIVFLYLGSVNNIIDIDFIVEFLSLINKTRCVKLILIGGGEKKQELIQKCNNNNLEFFDKGIIYDDEEKYNICKSCHFGLNIMKKEVFVGATMKSLEYFYYALPIINNIPADTKEIVDAYNCGFNLGNSVDDVVNQILNISDEEYIHMSYSARDVFIELFSENSNVRQMEAFFKS